ncbi:MAG: IS1182 family transposase, partial [bacterium]
MAKTYRDYEPDQSFLLPPNPRDWLPEGHVALFVDDLVDGLDLSKIYASYEREERGQPPHDPLMMTKLWTYAYTQGLHASRQLERKSIEDVGYRILAAGNTPDHVAFSRFRKRHLSDLADLFTQVLKLCQGAGLVKLGHVATDGTKVKANASRHKAMSYDRLVKEENRLRNEIEETLRKGVELDEAEDAADAPVPNRLPRGFETKKKRLAKIQEAKKRLEERARNETGKADAVPDPKAQTNFTDPESRILPTSSPKGAFDQAYNAQLSVDAKAQIIVATDVVQTSADGPTLLPMMDQVKQNTGRYPKKASADAGLFSEPNVEGLTTRGIDAYLAAGREKHHDPEAPAPRGRIPNGLS